MRRKFCKYESDSFSTSLARVENPCHGKSIHLIRNMPDASATSRASTLPIFIRRISRTFHPSLVCSNSNSNKLLIAGRRRYSCVLKISVLTVIRGPVCVTSRAIHRCALLRRIVGTPASATSEISIGPVARSVGAVSMRKSASRANSDLNCVQSPSTTDLSSSVRFLEHFFLVGFDEVAHQPPN